MRGRVYQVQIPKASFVSKVGDVVTTEVLLLPIPPYKISMEYPHVLAHDSTDAVQVLQPRITKETHKGMTEKRWIIKARFRVQKLGKHTLKGRFHFGVCSKTACYPRTVKVTWRFEGRKATSTLTPAPRKTPPVIQ
jgi:hypothetical protein